MQRQASFQATETGRLYLVPTPIGNLDDMTFRAIKVLKEVDLICAEDTRHTRQLLNHFEITTKAISFHEHNTEQRLPELVARLKQGENLAQCSDAGMPSISDPGKELVAACVKEGIPVVPPRGQRRAHRFDCFRTFPQPFYFYGFLERKHQQQVTELTALRNRGETMIFYEAPHRLAKTLTTMAEVFGEERQAVLARELTKRYEEFERGSLAELVAWAKEGVRGEFVVMVAGNDHPQEDEQRPSGTPLEQIQSAVDGGQSPNAAIKQVAKRLGLKPSGLV